MASESMSVMIPKQYEQNYYSSEEARVRIRAKARQAFNAAMAEEFGQKQ